VEVDCCLAGEDRGLDAVHLRGPVADQEGADVSVMEDDAAGPMRGSDSQPSREHDAVDSAARCSPC
jgi:hypothetical protein